MNRPVRNRRAPIRYGQGEPARSKPSSRVPTAGRVQTLGRVPSFETDLSISQWKNLTPVPPSTSPEEGDNNLINNSGLATRNLPLPTPW